MRDEPQDARITPRRRLWMLPGVGALLALTGCASTLSGIGGKEHYACKAPIGAQCMSVSGVYANAGLGAAQLTQAQPLPEDLPKRVDAPSTATSAPAAPPPQILTQKSTPISASTTPLRSAPRILRLWIAPWEDRDGDLHEAAVVHVLVDHGRWLIEHVRPARRQPPPGVTPPATLPAAGSRDAAPSSGFDTDVDSLPIEP
jgi:conjugal transfer pilus assembly protein TraV